MQKTISQSCFYVCLKLWRHHYMHASASTLKPLHVIYHSALRLASGAASATHHCTLYRLVGRTSSWALIGKLPIYISSLLAQSINTYNACFSNRLVLKNPIIRTELGGSAFSVYAPYIGNHLQLTLRLNSFTPFTHFTSLITTFRSFTCTCFLCSSLLLYLYCILLR